MSKTLTGETLRNLYQDVEDRFGVTPDQLKGVQRSKKLVSARIYFIRAARQLGYSTPQIGKAINKDNTTVLYHLKNWSGYERTKKRE